MIHKDYDGREIRAGHIGKNIKAVARWSYEDQYIVMVSGTFDNGAKVDNGQYCRESAEVIEKYLLPVTDDSPIHPADHMRQWREGMLSNAEIMSWLVAGLAEVQMVIYHDETEVAEKRWKERA